MCGDHCDFPERRAGQQMRAPGTDGVKIGAAAAVAATAEPDAAGMHKLGQAGTSGVAVATQSADQLLEMAEDKSDELVVAVAALAAGSCPYHLITGTDPALADSRAHDLPIHQVVTVNDYADHWP